MRWRLWVRTAVAIMMVCLDHSSACAGTINFSPERAEEVRIQNPAGGTSPGERLSYDVRWFGIPIGNGNIHIRRIGESGSSVCQIEASARANAFLSAFYPVRDSMRSLMDLNGYRSYEFEKDLREGRYQAHEKTVFDHDTRFGHYESFTNGSKKQIPLSTGPKDILTAFYWIRAQDLIVGSTQRTVVVADEKEWSLAFEVLGTRRMELRQAGQFEVVVLRPVAHFKGVLVDRGKALVYLSADRDRIPVKIELKTPYGPVVGILISREITDHLESLRNEEKQNELP